MSFDIWFQRFVKGEPDPFPREIVDELFRPYTVRATATVKRNNFRELSRPYL